MSDTLSAKHKELALLRAHGVDSETISKKYNISEPSLRRIYVRTDFKDEVARIQKIIEERMLETWEKSMKPIDDKLEELVKRLVDIGLKSASDKTSVTAIVEAVKMRRPSLTKEEEGGKRMQEIHIVTHSANNAPAELKLIEGEG